MLLIPTYLTQLLLLKTRRNWIKLAFINVVNVMGLCMSAGIMFLPDGRKGAAPDARFRNAQSIQPLNLSFSQWEKDRLRG
jgi:hypothetical protein